MVNIGVPRANWVEDKVYLYTSPKVCNWVPKIETPYQEVCIKTDVTKIKCYFVYVVDFKIILIYFNITARCYSKIEIINKS